MRSRRDKAVGGQAMVTKKSKFTCIERISPLAFTHEAIEFPHCLQSIFTPATVKGNTFCDLSAQRICVFGSNGEFEEGVDEELEWDGCEHRI